MTTRSLGLFLIWLTALGAFASADDNDPIKESPITESDRDHWAFKPIVRPSPPLVQQPVDNPIDAFILAALEEKQLDFAPPADKRTLLRRLSFDLTGLPPTEEELAAFEADGSPLAYEKQVDRLLASPAYGQRAALFWLDLARFAETDGFEHDLVRKDAWQYRDWVIEAFNRDLSYADFALAQLAGDEVHGESGRIATMFCLASPDMPDINDQSLRRHNRLNELTSTVGSVFLGLQMGCAQCHDHKYDPLSQGDFYRLRAIFESAVPDLKRDKPYNLFAAQEAVASPNAKPRFWVRGDVARPGPELIAAYPRIADVASSETDAQPNTMPTITRADFARWLARDKNPLFARVAVNRLWQQHFGKGIFTTPSDAGLAGVGPSHPELLDWLAVEFREQNWSIKSLHRKIVLSKTYRQASRGADPDKKGPEAALWKQRLTADPQNDLYSRFPRRRLEGETIRDAMLFAAGELNLSRGGPGVMPPLPAELVGTLLKGQWTVSANPADHYRRSIYLFARRNLRFPLFEAFDRPDPNESCPTRQRSTTAPQALVLLNGDFSIQMAQHAARRAFEAIPRLDEEAGKSRAELLFLRLLQRKPADHERDSLSKFLTTQSARITAEHADWSVRQIAEASLADAALALLNSNEFIYLE